WLNETFGRRVAPVSVFDRGLLIMSLAELGRFGEAAELEADAIRLAEGMQGAFVVGWAHMSAGALHLFKGDWARAHPIIEHATAVWEVAGDAGAVVCRICWGASAGWRAAGGGGLVARGWQCSGSQGREWCSRPPPCSSRRSTSRSPSCNRLSAALSLPSCA